MSSTAWIRLEGRDRGLACLHLVRDVYFGNGAAIAHIGLAEQARPMIASVAKVANRFVLLMPSSSGRTVTN